VTGKVWGRSEDIQFRQDGCKGLLGPERIEEVAGFVSMKCKEKEGGCWGNSPACAGSGSPQSEGQHGVGARMRPHTSGSRRGVCICKETRRNSKGGGKKPSRRLRKSGKETTRRLAHPKVT
jgi:hypothetical protein